MYQNNKSQGSSRIGHSVKKRLFVSDSCKVSAPYDQATADVLQQITAEPMTAQRNAFLRATVLRMFNRPAFVPPQRIGSISSEASQVTNNVMSTAERHRVYYQLLEKLKSCEIIDQEKQRDCDEEKQAIVNI